MLSLFWMAVCVEAQPTNNAVHTIAIRAINFAASAFTFVAISRLVGQLSLPSVFSLLPGSLPPVVLSINYAQAWPFPPSIG